MTDRAVGETLASRVEAITGFSSTGSEVTGAQRIPSGASTASGRGGTSCCAPSRLLRRSNEPATHHRKERSACWSEGQRARAAAEEGTAELCLDQADLMADCSRRQSQLIRGRFETHVARS